MANWKLASPGWDVSPVTCVGFSCDAGVAGEVLNSLRATTGVCSLVRFCGDTARTCSICAFLCSPLCTAFLRVVDGELGWELVGETVDCILGFVRAEENCGLGTCRRSGGVTGVSPPEMELRLLELSEDPVEGGVGLSLWGWT